MKQIQAVGFLVLFAALLVSCGGSGSGSAVVAPESTGVRLAAETQFKGDPVEGRRVLLNAAYMTCGIPYKLWVNPLLNDMVSQVLGAADSRDTIAGREGKNVSLPYWLNVFETNDGAEVVNANCLLCHAGKFDGELIIGVPNTTVDFTGGAEGVGSVPDAAIDLLNLTAAERDSFQTLLSRGGAIGGATQMRTVGMNPAEMLAVELMVHHDRDTLAWSQDEVTPLIVRDHNGSEIEDPRITSDPPPWWRVHKKNALFYNGMARGDHRGTMALATSVCVDDLVQAQKVDEWFKDLQAFVASVRAPKYKRSINEALAQDGQLVFNNQCAACHGTYADSDEDETYPNLLFPLDVIGTDPVVANAGVVHSPELVEWYNNSFYGKITRMEPNDPFPGYMAPPLDGIWATAPFLHNGSVPTIELVLDSTRRPAVWRRVDLDSSNFDEDALGWPYETLDYSWTDASKAERKMIYDTSFWSQSNAGHTFGDSLSSEDRRAVIEYLKTL